jgi:general secretion pathway protein G
VPLTAFLETLPQISVSPSIAFVVALAALAVCLVRIRFWRDHFTMFDAGAVLCVMTAGSMGLVPLIESSQSDAKAVALIEDLRTLRSQIELYKLQHRGNAPLLYKGTFPQLINPTNVVGVPGTPGRKFPFGPYLPRIPANPVTGVATVTPIADCPPTAATEGRGWLYHQASGRIFADVPEQLQR